MHRVALTTILNWGIQTIWFDLQMVLTRDPLYNHTTVQRKENICTWPLVTYHSNIFPTSGHASRGVDNRTL